MCFMMFYFVEMVTNKDVKRVLVKEGQKKPLLMSTGLYSVQSNFQGQISKWPWWPKQVSC